MRVLTVVAAVVALAAAAAPAGRAAGTGLPASWTAASTGPNGGVVYQGRIPNRFVPSDHRLSAVYLPPGYNPARRYRVVYLLHGMAGQPTSIWNGLHLADVADGLIASHEMQPFIAVMPVAGPTVDPEAGEWAGVWESYVVQDVVPWVDAHLATVRGPQGRALEGLCAGGFGAIDIGLRHPGVFGTLGSWEGYFAPVFNDGPFLDASAAVLRAHDPVLLVRRDAARLRRSKVRFYVSAGGNHGHVLRAWTVAFAHERGRDAAARSRSGIAGLSRVRARAARRRPACGHARVVAARGYPSSVRGSRRRPGPRAGAHDPGAGR